MMAERWAIDKSELQPHLLKGDKEPVRFYLFFRFVPVATDKDDPTAQMPDAALIDAPKKLEYWIDENRTRGPSYEKGAFSDGRIINPTPDGADRLEPQHLYTLSQGDLSGLNAGGAFEEFVDYWRQFASPQALQSILDVENLLEGYEWRLPLSSAFGFTWTGLRALGLHPGVLESFPEAFRQGMAARAGLLGDVGKSSPEFWDGALGDRGVHGVVSLSLSAWRHWPEDVRLKIRDAVRFLNGAREDESSALSENGSARLSLRSKLATLTRKMGFEILHAEFGEAPYYIGADGVETVMTPRVEHFGFRDGISQPFVLCRDEDESARGDGRKTTTPNGGGRPLADGSWAPVAPGELFLGYPGEIGHEAQTPASPWFRRAGTYMVFRKLQQDVFGFHSFVSNRRRTEDERVRFAAHMMGRWFDGTPVVDSPNRPFWYAYNETEESYEAKKKAERSQLNDFRYEDRDPHGRVCPIGAHVRRCNPRDLQDGEAARQHRILRRGISYGGTFIEPDWRDTVVNTKKYADLQERGMLFVALNASIETQFELIQREWINGGEFTGKAGAGVCPIAGAHSSDNLDMFTEGGRIAPDTHLPTFVTMKGGDYFFVPRLEVLDELMNRGGVGTRCDFDADRVREIGWAPAVPGLFTLERMEKYSEEIMNRPGNSPVKKVQIKSDAGELKTIAFVARHADVKVILNDDRTFSVEHLHDASARIMQKSSVLGLPHGDSNRKKWFQKLSASISLLENELAIDDQGAINSANGGEDRFYEAVRKFARAKSHEIVDRLLPIGRIDLLQDLGYYVPYLVGERFFGVKGPDWLTPVAVASKFAQFKITDVPRQWLAHADGVSAALAPYLTMQTWMRFAFAEVFVNIVQSAEMTLVTRQAAQEFLLHLETEIAKRRMRPTSHPENLLAALIEEGRRRNRCDAPKDLMLSRRILTDLLPPLCVNVGNTFARIMEVILDQRFDLREILENYVGADGNGSRMRLDAFIDEVTRVNSVPPLILRTVRSDGPVTLPSKAVLSDGDLVVMMIFAANRDPYAFENPHRFIVDPESEARAADNYLNFGYGPHKCWGARLGRLLLGEMLRAAARMPRLRRAAGPGGRTTENPPRMAYSLIARFTKET